MPQINRRFTDCRKFPRSISVKSIVVVMSQKRMPPGILPLPPRGGRAWPVLVISFVLRFLEAIQCRQRFFEIRSMPYRHRVGTHKIRTDPPVATIYINFFFCGNMGRARKQRNVPELSEQY